MDTVGDKPAIRFVPLSPPNTDTLSSRDRTIPLARKQPSRHRLDSIDRGQVPDLLSLLIGQELGESLWLRVFHRGAQPFEPDLVHTSVGKRVLQFHTYC